MSTWIDIHFQTSAIQSQRKQRKYMPHDVYQSYLLSKRRYDCNQTGYHNDQPTLLVQVLCTVYMTDTYMTYVRYLYILYLPPSICIWQL